MQRASARVVLVVAAALAFAAVNLNNALHKGGDFDVFLDAGWRVWHGQPLYAGSWTGGGVLGPPFQGVFFVPFAAIAAASPVAARIVWYLVGLAALGTGVAAWTRAASAADERRTWIRADVLWPLLAIVLPAQTNFEHQNMNPLLLARTGASALALARGRQTAAGASLGAAVALKAFPAPMIAVFALRREWRATIAAIGTAAALTCLPALVYGPSGAMTQVADWLALSRAGNWPARPQNQSVLASCLRAVGDARAAGELAALLIVLLLAVVGWIVWRRRTAPAPDATADLATALVASVLVSPIAWDHYWLLAFPALQWSARERRALFWVAAVLISGLSPVVLGAHGFQLARMWSNSTVAGVCLIAARAGRRAPCRQKKRPA